MKKRILIVDNSISFTGAFKCALNEATLLSDKYEFLFVVPHGSSVVQKLKEQHYQFYTLPILEISKSARNLLLYLPYLIKNSLTLYRIIRKEKVSVIQINDFYNLLGVSLKLLGYKGKLVTYVRFLPLSLPAPLRKTWTVLAQKFSNTVIAVSDAVWKQLPPNDNTIRVYDALLFSESNSVFVKENTNKIVLLYLANYIRGKGQDFALKAMIDVVKQNQAIILKFYGSDMGLEKNKNFKSELQKFVSSNNLEKYVQFGSFSNNIEQLIKEADVVLNFSESESFSMTCAEASFYGRPVIATKCGGPEEIILQDKTGILVENRNINQMIEAILVLTSNSEKREMFAQNAKKYVMRKFRIEEFTNVMENVFR